MRYRVFSLVCADGFGDKRAHRDGQSDGHRSGEKHDGRPIPRRGGEGDFTQNTQKIYVDQIDGEDGQEPKTRRHRHDDNVFKNGALGKNSFWGFQDLSYISKEKALTDWRIENNGKPLG